MSELLAATDRFEKDRELTLRNRRRLSRNTNLLYWYGQLYKEELAGIPEPSRLRILEIGSGVSPLKHFYDSVLTSDILPLDYLDYVFDCHDIDRFADIADESLDRIVLTNVLHHLRSPIDFLVKSCVKLKKGGEVIATEPYFSILSTLVFKYLHHEPVDFGISEPLLADIQGPLASANIALPWLIFVRHPQWSARLKSYFDFDANTFQLFSSLSYMATGGISHRIPIPLFLYKILFHVDLFISRMLPQLFASFFTIRLTRR